METLVCVFPGPVALGLLELSRAMSEVGSVQKSPDGEPWEQVVIERGSEHAYVRLTNDPGDEPFDDWPPDLVPKVYQIVAIDYRGLALARDLVVALAARYEFLVDTNFGEVLTSGDFVHRCATEGDWNWEVWA